MGVPAIGISKDTLSKSGGTRIVSSVFVYSGTELEAMAEARNYTRWIAQFFSPYLGESVVEVGAGSGSFARVLLESHAIAHMELFEPSANLFPLLAERFAGDPRIALHNTDFNRIAPRRPADSIVLVNVLEHIADDDDMIRSAWVSLRPGGALLLFVPALRWLYGSLDRAFEHHRRYTKSALAGKLREAGFAIEQIRYVNFPGIASWFLASKILQHETITPARVRFYDRVIVPWCTRLEKIWEPPIGQSLLAIGIKPE